MNHSYTVRCGDLLIRPLCQEDIEHLRNWRNDPAQTRFLRPIGYITPQMQNKWYEAYLDNKNEITFAIVETKELNRIVGSVALYDVTEDSAEIGKIQIGDADAHGKGVGRRSVAMVLQVAFRELGLNRVIASVHTDNIASYKIFIKNGFEKIGSHASVIGGYEDILELKNTGLQFAKHYQP